jgi:hypothetical protein
MKFAMPLVLTALLAGAGCRSTATCRPNSLFVKLKFGTDAAQADALEVTLTVDGKDFVATTAYKGGETLEVTFPKGKYVAGEKVRLLLVAERHGQELARVSRDDLILPASCAAVQLSIGHIDGGLENGAACSSGDQCKSTFCVDHFCCNSQCAGQCEACDVGSSEGQCVAVSSGLPHGSRPACAGQGSSCAGTCTATARNACTYPGPSVTCSDQSCTGNTKYLASGCDQAGGCRTQETLTCPQGCDGNDCVGACQGDNDCGDPSFPYCDRGVCTAGKPRGRDCANGSECNSTFCADGFCCDTACDGQCESCAESGNIGTCVFRVGEVVTGHTPSRTACAGTAECLGSCNGTSKSCNYPDSSITCGAETCSNGKLLHIGACDAAGGCPQPMEDCPNGACDSQNPNVCGPCMSDQDCGNTRWCDTGTCVPQRDLGGSCTSVNQCASGFCVSSVGGGGKICCASSCSGEMPNCSSDGINCACSATSCGSGKVCNSTNLTCCTPSCPICVKFSGTSNGCGGTCGVNCSSGFCCGSDPCSSISCQ